MTRSSKSYWRNGYIDVLSDPNHESSRGCDASRITVKRCVMNRLFPVMCPIEMLISGDVPQFLACEADGQYITYKVDKNNKLVLLKAR